jgi:translation elongation factor EF-4
MDSEDQERERGITILAKNLAVQYAGHKFNILDTVCWSSLLTVVMLLPSLLPLCSLDT